MTVKVSDIAEKLGMTSKDIIAKATSMDIDVSAANSVVSKEEAKAIEEAIHKASEGTETKVVSAGSKKVVAEEDDEPKVQVKAAKIVMPKTKKTQTKNEKKTESSVTRKAPIGRPITKAESESRRKPAGKPITKKEKAEKEAIAAKEKEAILAEQVAAKEAEQKKTEPVKNEEPKFRGPKIIKKAEDVKKEEEARKAAAQKRAEEEKAAKEKRHNERKNKKDKHGDKHNQKQGDKHSERKVEKSNENVASVESMPVNPEKADRKSKKKDKDKERENRKNKKRERNNGGEGNHYGEKSLEKKTKKKKNQKQKAKPEPEVEVEMEEMPVGTKVINVPITVAGYCEQVGVSVSQVIMTLMKLGIVTNINANLDEDTALILSEELGVNVVIGTVEEEDIDEGLETFEDKEEDLVSRPPIITVMGHVDHGKTSLLDAIRHTDVIGGEAGGITQHIGAYVVDVKGEKITFLDTPGHEAFTAMRMRGASSTDIAILVVAADDGVMPQTVEAINHAKAAGVEIIVAVNKIDKPSANIERVKQELTEYELIPEDWGGSTIFVPVSAKTGEGLEDLMEMIVLTAEVMELKANPNRRARGLVLEAQLDKGRGPVSTVLVQKGTLRVGDAIAAGSAHGKVRAMMDDKGRRVKEAGPSVPVEILGLNDVPNAGEVFVGCANDKEARNFAETFISQSKVKLLEETKSKLSLDDLFTQIQEGNLKELNIVVKADVQGSVEAIKQSLLKLSNDEVVVKIIHGGVGAVNESDVSLASASNAIIIGFNVRPDATAKETADREGVDIRLYRVIYNAIEDVEAAMKGMLDPVFEEKVLGHAEVRQLFKASGVGTIAGSYVLDGTFERDCSVRITRDGIVVFEGALASLKRFKDDVKEVRTGYECGFVFANFNDVKEGDLVEAFKMVEIPR